MNCLSLIIYFLLVFITGTMYSYYFFGVKSNINFEFPELYILIMTIIISCIILFVLIAWFVNFIMKEKFEKYLVYINFAIAFLFTLIAAIGFIFIDYENIDLVRQNIFYILISVSLLLTSYLFYSQIRNKKNY
ncbi:hypothetical protein STABA_v1c04040 [Spiroplasma tabanidicola]|uniref:Uncharacterized protein n=2 Tax=Spiroplasma tabanidicola TaxID=324079 RepID=A0A6I6C4N8_9MOLU|nr:hypothetical protein STABA_v1c04040 [Spiroplasma tabanidicola]